jgi:hypothetical protein
MVKYSSLLRLGILIESSLQKKHRHYFHSSGINFNDVLIRYGLTEDTQRPPFIPGFECSGEVLDIGTNVTHIAVRILKLITKKFQFDHIC